MPQQKHISGHIYNLICWLREWWITLGAKKRVNYVADFETTTDPDDCRVWAYGLADIDTATTLWDVEIGTSIERFCNRMAEENSVCYFHNLKFDSAFILDYLFRQGYRHVDDNPRKGQFTSLISNMGAFYSITVTWKNGMRTEFRDSLKKLPYSVSVIAKAFKLDEAKGQLDYDLYRPVGHIATADERSYIANDVLIVARALKTQFDSGMTKLTVGSDALNEFKTITGTRLFDKLFPVLPEVMDQEIRAAYRGGWTIAPERFRRVIQTTPGAVYDVNSLYPSVMYDRLLPYGEPIYAPGLPVPDKDYPLFIVSITFTATIKPGHVPCIQVKGSSFFLATEYQTVISEPVTMSCTNIDLALWEEHYDLDILSYNGGWLFHGVTGLFTEYIDKWMEVKANNTGAMRALAKLMLNSLYGKFATNPSVTPKIPVFDDENDVVKLVMGDDDTRDPVYTAMGAFITAYARKVTIDAAQANYDVFAYADTDSLHLLTTDPPVGLEIDDNKLGTWKKEYEFEEALFVRAKAYIERLPDGGHVTHVAGLPDRIAHQMTIADFQNGRRFAGKLQPKRVPGGMVLEDVGFTMNTE